ncbi:hypothetical protein [Microbacterium candidum]|uniref:Uncharacterized protein n=1 Tax=Microbacterium candidum TaxID=3041922 RepID=A0ABT7MWC5_9MICO|nr:hypothetical protein [Microbacterium sp. ASV49]MDL9978754.1 hypothetical protein [Microbacterium sp. ASV49]
MTPMPNGEATMAKAPHANKEGGAPGLTNFRVDDRIFIDESKARGYYVIATATAFGSIHATNKLLRELLKPGQNRLHFKSESDSRRRLILSTMSTLDVRVSVWGVRGLPDKVARPRCLEALVEEAATAGASQLIIERDASLERADRQLIAGVLRRTDVAGMRYEHCAPHEQPLLWVSDAVAWCYSNGGDWVRRVEAIVEGRVARL